MNMECSVQVRLGSALRVLRGLARMSQEELGKLLGLHQAAVSRVERGTQALLPSQILTVANEFDVSMESLLA